MTSDRIDQILQEWQQQAPEFKPTALAIVGRLLRISRFLEKHREMVLANYGLNVWSFDVVATLRRQGSPYQLKPTDLYGLLMLSSGAMTNRIDRLEKDGIVVRLRDPDDRRGVIVQLTDQGVQLANTVMPVLFEREQALLTRFLAPDEAETLIPLLRRFLLSLEQEI